VATQSNEDWLKEYVAEEARIREALHKGQASSRPLSKGYEAVGMMGEMEFGKFSGLMPDMSARADGDSGIDFTVQLKFTVDVKTARKPAHLIHEEGKTVVDIYVLARYNDDGSATLLGWEWGSTLSRAPTKDFGYGVISHYIPAENLRPMEELEGRMVIHRMR
jgi:hypothetical protein